jgi:hypothetical protein
VRGRRWEEADREAREEAASTQPLQACGDGVAGVKERDPGVEVRGDGSRIPVPPLSAGTALEREEVGDPHERHEQGGRERQQAADSDSASRSTSSALPREDKDLHSKDDMNAEPVGCHFLPIFCKMKDTESFAGLVGDALAGHIYITSGQTVFSIPLLLVVV